MSGEGKRSQTYNAAFAPDWLCLCGHQKDSHPQRESGEAGGCDECGCRSFRSRAESESLDDFMARYAEDTKTPNSIKRIAWATGKTIQEVVDDLSK